MTEETRTRAATHICVDCKWHNGVPPRAIWYDHYCLCPDAQGEHCQNPVTGDWGFCRSNDLGGRYITAEPPNCRYVNQEGECPHFEPPTPRRPDKESTVNTPTIAQVQHDPARQPPARTDTPTYKRTYHQTRPTKHPLRGLSRHEYGQTAHWRALRRRALRAAHYRCQDCGQKASQVHHLTYPGNLCWDKDDIQHLVALCGPCHAARHGRPPTYIRRELAEMNRHFTAICRA